MAKFKLIQFYGDGQDGQLDFQKIESTWFNVDHITAVESTINEINNNRRESIFYTTDGGEYYSPLDTSALLQLLK